MEKNNLLLPKKFLEKIMLKQYKKMNFFCQNSTRYILFIESIIIFSLVNKENKKIKFEK